MESEGLFTYVWGSIQWQSLHNISFNYPYEPTEEDKKKYYNYFVALGDVLPCCSCRKHFKENINSEPTKFTYDVLKNRDTLTKWLFDIHKRVCGQVGFDYDITYEMMCKKYNSFIAKCDLTAEQKQSAFVNLYDVHAPVVQYDILKCFVGYAKKRGFDKFLENIAYYNSLDRESNEWYVRNQKCQEIIKNNRMNGKDNVEMEGEYKGLPTFEELQLLELTSTTIPKQYLKKMLQDNLKCSIIKKYKLV